MNAIFAVEVRQESDFACRAIRLPLCNASFLFFRENRDRFSSATIRKRFFIDTRSRNWLRAFHAVGQREEFIPAVSNARFALSFPILFPSLFSVPTPLYFLGFPLSFSISSIYGNVNRRNGLIGFISRSRCPQFQFSRACVFSVLVEIRSVYSG